MKRTPASPSEISRIESHLPARSLLKGRGWLFLDANESPDPGPPLSLDVKGLNRYPDPLATELRAELARWYGLAQEQVMVSHGADELIDLCVAALVRRDRGVLALVPSYGMYRVAASARGVFLRTLPFPQDGRLDPGELQRQAHECDLLFLCSPNNPTGTPIPLESVRATLERFPGTVVVDEAYQEFAAAEGIPSALGLLQEGAPNLVLLRTFSKAFGAAGLRLGYGLGPGEKMERLRRLKPPYNVGTVAQRLGLALWRQRSRMEENVVRIIQGRHRLARGLERLGCRVVPSRANFLLFRLPREHPRSRVYRQLRDRYRIVLRCPPETAQFSNTLRVSVGGAAEMTFFLEALEEVLA